MTSKFLPLTLVGLLLSSGFARADSPAYIPVGQAKAKKTPVAMAPIQIQSPSSDAPGLIKTISTTFENDLAFMDLFRLLPPSTFIESAEQQKGLTPDKFRFADWNSIGAEILVKSGISTAGNNMTYEVYLYDVYRGKQLLAKKYVGTVSDVVVIAHTFANDFVKTLTGLPGIFLTKTAMSCDRTRKKEIYVMDFDGTNVKQITHHRSISFAPAWHPQGTKLAYSLYVRHKDNVKNIDLYEFDFATNRIHLLSNRKGINSGAFYHPSGKSLALTMSFMGNPEIFSLDLTSRNATRLTHSMGFDVDPAWSPNGDHLTFVSSRSGKPMVYSMRTDGSQTKRLTYAGQYNATPSWSPQNNKIAFAGWLDNHFDIFIMNPDGTNIERLTKNQGNNEDPSFSPDGNFVIFSSDRTGGKNIYVMNLDGTFVKRLTYGLGNCVTPKWSNSPPAR